MATTGNFTITRKTTFPRLGRRTLRRTFKTAEAAVAWLNRDVAAKSPHRDERTGRLPGDPFWVLRANGREVLRVDRYGNDHGPWA